MINIDVENSEIVFNGDKIPFNNPKAFEIISDIWLRVGWDLKHVYSFTWLGRPIIQLPEDMIRAQEVIYMVQPNLIIETGVAHGGSLIFFSSLLRLMNIDRRKVLGIDIDIRKNNKISILNHPMSSEIELIEGSSISDSVYQKVLSHISANDKIMIFLDSNHAKEHVARELDLYAPLINVGSYIVATDGIMSKLAGAPRSNSDWSWNNPLQAALEFVNKNNNYIIEEPTFPFNEGSNTYRVTYWPKAWIKRVG